PNSDAVMAGILKEVDYPTGGKTIFNYEPNFIEEVINTAEAYKEWNFSVEMTEDDITNNLKVKQKDIAFPAPFVLDPNENIPFNDIEFSDKFNITVSFYLKDNDGNPEQLNSGSSFIKFLENGISFTENSLFTTKSLGQDGYWIINYSGEITLEDIKNINEILRLSIGGSLGNKARVRLSTQITYPIDEELRKINVGGIRISTVENRNSEGKFLSKKSYKYVNNKGFSSGKLLVGSPLSFLNSEVLYKDDYIINCGCYDPKEIVSDKLIVADYSKVFNSGPILSYTEVIESNLDSNGKSNGFVKHYFGFNRDLQTTFRFPYVPRVSTPIQRGKELKTSIFQITNSKDTIKLNEKINEYDLTLSESLNSYKVVPNRSWYWDWVYEATPFGKFGSFGPCIDLKYLDNQYVKAEYKRYSNWQYISKTIDKSYFGGDSLIVITEHDYYHNKQLIKSVRKTSPTVSKITEYTYPFNYSSSDDPYYKGLEHLNEKNVISKPVETRYFDYLGDDIINTQEGELVKPIKQLKNAVFNKYVDGEIVEVLATTI
ncbi:MAG: hypothetical protein R3321_07180, partial [Nitrososphaeraceae archaeon]|nr:hypothetical protein [Nitrososphaeraceae archaeon]